jgi:hypothetical protein
MPIPAECIDTEPFFGNGRKKCRLFVWLSRIESLMARLCNFCGVWLGAQLLHAADKTTAKWRFHSQIIVLMGSVNAKAVRKRQAERDVVVEGIVALLVNPDVKNVIQRISCAGTLPFASW